MKYYIMTFLFLILNFSGYQLSSQNDSENLTKVNEVKLSKNDIYSKSMKWIAIRYTSPKKVMEYSDKEEGIITFSGATQFVFEKMFSSKATLFYKVTINIKDKKYKINLEPTYALDHMNRRINGIPKDFMPGYNDEFLKINNDLLDYLNGKTKNDDF